MKTASLCINALLLDQHDDAFALFEMLLRYFMLTFKGFYANIVTTFHHARKLRLYNTLTYTRMRPLVWHRWHTLADKREILISTLPTIHNLPRRLKCSRFRRRCRRLRRPKRLLVCVGLEENYRSHSRSSDVHTRLRLIK